MAGEEILGHGKIIVEVEQNVRRELAEAEAQFDRTMEKLDRKEAELRLAIDAKQFEAEYKKIQAQLAEWEKKKATATATLDTRKAVENIDKLEKRRKNLALQEERLNNQSKQLASDRAAAEDKYMKAIERGDEKLAAARIKQANTVAKATKVVEQRRTKEQELEFQRRARAAEKAMRDEMATEQKRVRTVLAARERLNAQTAREDARAFQDRARMANMAMRDEIKTEQQVLRAKQKAASDAQRMREIDLAQAKKLQAQYFKDSKKRAELADKRERVFLSKGERIELDVDIDRLDEQLAKVRARLEMIGQPPPTIEFDVDERGSEALSRWASALSDTTVRLGPFTSTIGGAIRALTLLGPVIAGVVGAAGALAGAIGVGVAGAVGLGAAAVTGFVPLLLGTVTAVKPIITEFSNAAKAQKKYDDAVAKHGATSKQAKAAQQELNSVMAHMPESTQKAVKGVSDLKKAWQDEVGGTARQNFGKVLTQGIESANRLMPMFAARTRGFMNKLTTGFTDAMKGLSSANGKSTLDTIFTNANKSLGPFLHGLSAIGAAFGHITAEFSKYLPDIAKGFDKWAQGLNDASKGSGMVSAVHTMVDGFKGLVHLVGSATKLIGTFFGVAAGRGGGISFMNDIADGLDRITANISSNPQGLGNFFKDSIATAKDLYGVIAPLASLFIEWATIMRPFSNIILSVAGSLGKVTAAIAGFGPTRDLLVVAFSVFLAGTLVSKIMSVVGAVKEVGTALAALGKVKLAGAVLDFVTGGASGNVANMFGRGGGKKAAGNIAADVIDYAAVGGGIKATEKAAGSAAIKMGALEAGAAAAGAEVATMGTLATVAATGGLALVAGAAVFGGYKLLTMKSSSEKLRDSLKQIDAASKNLDKTINASAGVTNAAGMAQRDYSDSIGKVAALKKQLNDLEAHGGKNTADYKNKLAQLNQELDRRQVNENAAFKYGKAADVAAIKLTASILKTSDAHGKLNAALAEQKKRQAEVDRTGTPESKQMLRDATNDVAKAQATYNRELFEQERAQRQAAVNSLNYSRTLAGMVPIAGRAATAIANLYKRAPTTAKTIALKFADPKDAGAVAAKASNAIKNGVKSNIVMKIVGDSRNAEEAIRRINAMKLATKNQKILTSGGPAAIKMLETIIGRKLSAKEQHIAQAGGPAVLAMLGKIMGVKIPPKTATVRVIAGSALAMINSVISRMGQLSNKQVYIDTYYRTHGSATPGGQSGTGKGGASRPGGVAMGGPVSPMLKRNGVTPPTKALTALDKRIEWAANSAGANTKRTTGGKYSRPTFLVGEQNRPEYVIATNPAYKKRNKGILANAARDMGYQLATKTGHVVTAAATGLSSMSSSLGKISNGAGFYANTNKSTIGKDRPPTPSSAKTLKRTASKSKKKTTAKKLSFKQRRGWANYVEGLQTQQGYLEREVSIREGEVREPEDMVVQTGTTPVIDPTDGSIEQVPTYAPNPKIESEYKPDLRKVDEAYQMLVAIIAELVRSIPQAISAINIEKGIRKASSDNLDGLIKKENNRFHGLSDKGKKDHKSAHEQRISRLTSAKSDEDSIIADLINDRKDLIGAQVDAGFDYREANDAKAANMKEHDSASGDAQASANDQNQSGLDSAVGNFDKPDSSGSGGSGSDSAAGPSGPTLSQQTGLADTERANILRDFAGNAYGANGGAASSAMGGAQANLSGLGGIASAMTAPMAAGLAGAAAMFSGGSSGAAFAGGAAAAGMMAGSGITGTSATTAAGGGDVNKTVNIVNNFAAPPPDANTWVQGVEFEANAAV